MLRKKIRFLLSISLMVLCIINANVIVFADEASIESTLSSCENIIEKMPVADLEKAAVNTDTEISLAPALETATKAAVNTETESSAVSAAETTEVSDKIEVDSLEAATKKTTKVPPVKEEVEPLEIVYFKADNNYIGPNKSVVLKWKVLNAEKVEITGDENINGYSFPNEGSIEVWPSETTTFILKAYGINGKILTWNVMVNVICLEIKEFSASQTVITPGAITLLTWNVPGASCVNILNATEKELPFDGTIEVNPVVTTTYKLEAYGFDGSYISKELTIKVKDIEIMLFTADKTEIEPGEYVKISWDGRGFKNVKILEIISGEMPLQGSLQVRPSTTTTYTLEAISYNGNVKTKYLTIKVKQLKIIAFSADKTLVHKGEMVKLYWVSENAVNCSIYTNLGHKLIDRPATGSIMITPNRDMIYQLIAVDKMGNEVRKSLYIMILN